VRYPAKERGLPPPSIFFVPHDKPHPMPAPVENMDPSIILSAFEERKIFSHEGEEFMYVSKTTHESAYNNKRYVLEEGGAIYFDSPVANTGKSIGGKEQRLCPLPNSYKR
jgi:hypothetical protein